MLPNNINKLNFCLGWDTTCDIDASIIGFDNNGYEFKNTCFFG
jgi:hypothetical protein